MTDLSSSRPQRVLVVTDHSEASPALLDALVARSLHGGVQFRLVVLNPAHAEVHLLHPERHEKAAAAEAILRRVVPQIEEATGASVIGSVSIRHDPMDAIEATMEHEPVDEIMLALPQHHFATWLHQDLAHRLGHWGLPVHTVDVAVGHPAVGTP